MDIFLAVFTLWQREMVRFYRQPSRVIGALGSPLLFWLLIGAGVGRTFVVRAHGRAPLQLESINYLQYFFPGTLLLILLFTAVFSTISIIEDRREGFLQAVLVAPIPRAALVLGKVLGGASLALTQALLFLFLAPFVGIPLHFFSWAATAGILFLTAFMLTSLGFLIAWQFESIQGFHAVMNLFLMPLWLLSGALFPPEGAHAWIRGLMQINPLTYALASLRISIFGSPGPGVHFPLGLSVAVNLAFGLVLFFLAAISARRFKVS